MPHPVWRQIQKTNLSTSKQLAEYLELDPDLLSVSPHFSTNVPLRLAKKMPKNDPDDPLVRQFVPLKEEKQMSLRFSTDPVQDRSFCKSPKLLQKYKERALIITSSGCAMHCRFCFRKNFPYESPTDFKQELALIASDPTLKEIILSGGDPLSLSDQTLQKLLHSLEQIDHVQIIRFHSRFPIGIPERIDSSFLQLLSSCKKQVLFMIHANHPKELDMDVLQALKAIQCLGIPVLLQSVLLRGVNDTLETLKELFETSISNGIIPYYLHQLDRVTGTMHFEVSIKKGKALIEKLQTCLPGYAIPRFVQEIPGHKSKTIL